MKALGLYCLPLPSRSNKVDAKSRKRRISRPEHLDNLHPEV